MKASNPFALAPHRDVGAHGTHVAGIAAGNGRAGAGQFTGVAPDADLIVVAVAPEAGRTLGRSVRAFEAFTYIVQRSNGRPVAINLSQGMNGGGHSGETVLETGLDNLVRQPGVVVVKSAGNEQEWRTHARRMWLAWAKDCAHHRIHSTSTKVHRPSDTGRDGKMMTVRCHFCGSDHYEERRIEYLYSHEGKYLLVPNAPVEVCLNCGMIYYATAVLKEIERRFFAIQEEGEKPDRYIEVPVEAFG